MSVYIRKLTDDASISLAQKNDRLKTLAVVLKNLIDPNKGGASGDAGLKYRTLKLDNPKLRSRLFCSSPDGGCVVLELLTDASMVGMTRRESILVMDEPPSPTVADIVAMRILPAVRTAQLNAASELEAAKQPNGAASSQQTKRVKLAEHNNANNSGGGVKTSLFHPTEKLSEKQKARRLLEERKRLEKERDKAFRRETKARIAADKMVRKHDENWKPSVSAAADKTGTGLQTFRDRHGE